MEQLNFLLINGYKDEMYTDEADGRSSNFILQKRYVLDNEIRPSLTTPISNVYNDVENRFCLHYEQCLHQCSSALLTIGLAMM